MQNPGGWKYLFFLPYLASHVPEGSSCINKYILGVGQRVPWFKRSDCGGGSAKSFKHLSSCDVLFLGKYAACLAENNAAAQGVKNKSEVQGIMSSFTLRGLRTILLEATGKNQVFLTVFVAKSRCFCTPTNRCVFRARFSVAHPKSVAIFYVSIILLGGRILGYAHKLPNQLVGIA